VSYDSYKLHISTLVLNLSAHARSVLALLANGRYASWLHRETVWCTIGYWSISKVCQKTHMLDVGALNIVRDFKISLEFFGIANVMVLLDFFPRREEHELTTFTLLQ
jgi:hypothetical protein